MNLEKLKEPFAPSEVSWRIGQAGKNRQGIWAKVLAYIDNRCIQDRLDAVVGPTNWKNEFCAGPGGGVLCGISIKIEGEWITKWDGAENSDIEAVKGGLSDAMKRSAVQWGIGRYLYEIGESWATIHENKTEGSHYANCKIKSDGKEEWVNFHWTPPKLPANAMPKGSPQADPPAKPKPTKPALPAGVTTGDKIKPPGMTAAQVLASVPTLENLKRIKACYEFCESELVAQRYTAAQVEDVCLALAERAIELCNELPDYEQADALIRGMGGKMRIHDAKASDLRIKLADDKEAKLGAAA